MWRYDAGHSANSPADLPEQISLDWMRRLGRREPAWEDPLNRDLMQYDQVFEPIILDGKLYLGFNDRDKVAAYDLTTGEELWSFFADGPVRLPPVGWNGRVYFCSDDGFLYCVDASNGELDWKFRGAPNARKSIGNRRIISAWPARGGPVIRDGRVYFAASIWPFMGTFLYALDGKTGEVIWVNDSSGSQYIQQPHSAPSFAGVAPQGVLTATQDLLLVPGGRSVPAVFDRQSGEQRYFHLNAGGKGTGGSFLAADEARFFLHTRERRVRAFDLKAGVKTAFQLGEPVLAGDRIYAAAVAEKDGSRIPVVRAYDGNEELLWELPVDGSGDLIRAGTRLYAAGVEAITAINLPTSVEAAPQVAESIPVIPGIVRLVAGGDRLVASTLGGDILVFGEGSREETSELSTPQLALNITSDDLRRASKLLTPVTDPRGYAICFQVDDELLLNALVGQSEHAELSIVDARPDTVDRMRRRYERAGSYGDVTVHEGTPRDYWAPQFTAHQVIAGVSVTTEAITNDSVLRSLYRAVRPYGGVLQLLCPTSVRKKVVESVRDCELEQASVEIAEYGVLIRRVGRLPGSADWTHQHGDVANTLKSDDQRVKLPLGVLWFGGNTNMDVLPRHGHGPPEQVVGGRLFIEGINSITARDVYTGRDLWKKRFADLGTFDVYYDKTYRDTPLDPAYNQVHIPGANARGTNYVVTEDRVYIVEQDRCHILDPQSGTSLGEVRLPEGSGEQWGFVGVYDDLLIGGAGFANYRARHGLSFAESDAKLKSSRAGFGSKSYDRSASASLIAFDRYSGKVLWQAAAQHSFWHNGIVAGGGKVYCLDRNPRPIEDALRRRGKSAPATYRIVAFDSQTGDVAWQRTGAGEVFGTWLGYSEQFDALLQAGAAGSDRLTAEVSRGMSAYNGSDGSLLWRNDSLKYSGPCVLHHDLILTNAPSRGSAAGAFHLLTGKPRMIEDPLTGTVRPWTIERSYGCNNVIASEHLLTFRSGAAGFYDLATDGGTGNLGGFKSGCTSNLVVANGILNAPDYTRTCSCAYQNQTSLGLIHMPEGEWWTVNTKTLSTEDDQRVRELGINFGAPGDRRGEDGVMWLEYPEISGTTGRIGLDLSGQPSYFLRHSSAIADRAMNWVHASGVRGMEHIRIRLADEVAGSGNYRVTLYFPDPRIAGVKEYDFDIAVEGKHVIRHVQMPDAGKTSPVTAVLDNMELDGTLDISFTARRGLPVLSGIQVRSSKFQVSRFKLDGPGRSPSLKAH